MVFITINHEFSTIQEVIFSYPLTSFLIAASLNKNRKQAAIIVYMILEGVSVANIYQRLLNVYGKFALDATIMRKWISRVNGNLRDKEKMNLSNRPCSGRPAAAVD